MRRQPICSGLWGHKIGHHTILAWLVACVFWLGIALSTNAFASGPAAQKWRTITTPHFRVHYHRSVAKMAPDVAQMCEDAYATLVPVFQFHPRRKTHVVLLDASEVANGSATVFPRPIVRLYAVPSASYDTRTDTAQWMREMILHEYAHILHMDQIYGWVRAINMPFGRMFMPNQSLPRWFIEGTAVALESRYSKAGRVRSHFFQMYLDAILLAGTIPTLGQLSNSPPAYPYARLWYLAGGEFVAWIGRKYGWDALFKAYRQHGHRLRSIAANLMIWNVTGKTFDELYKAWLKDAYNTAYRRDMAIRSAGVVAPTPVTTTGYDTRWIAATPDGKHVHWIRADGRDDPTLVEPKNPHDRRPRVRTSTPFSLFPDGKTAVISRSTRVRDGYMRNDLFRVDLQSGRIRRLTRGLRASQPAVSPDGKTIAYVRPRNGRFDLYLYDISTQTTRRLVRADDWTTISQPSWMPDGSAVLYSLSKIGGGRDLYAIEPDDGTVTQLTDDLSIDDSPRISPDGRWLYYVSDRDKTFNIYGRDLEAPGSCRPGRCAHPSSRADKRVTRVRTGVFAPVVVKNDGQCSLWMSLFSAKGFDVARLDLNDDCSPKGHHGKAPKSYTRPDIPVVHSPAGERTKGPHRYHTGWLAHPWSWSPIYQQIGPYRQLGLSSHGEDPAGRFAWRADLSIGDPFNQLRWAVDMRFRMTTPEFFVNTTRSVRRRAMLLQSRTKPYDQEITTVSVGTGYSFGGIRATQRIALSYNWEKRSFWRDRTLHYDPGGLRPIVPSLGMFSNVYLSYSVSNLRSYVRSVSEERGWRASVGIRIRDPILGADYQSRSFSFSITKAIPIHRWRRHALVLRLVGAFAQSSERRPVRYVVGGPADQNLWQALQYQVGAPTRVVRGFKPAQLRSTHYMLLNAEYRFPLLWLDWAYSTLPLFFQRIYGAVFVDAATTFEPNGTRQNTIAGVGAELRMDLTIGYNFKQELRLGVARGIGPDGIWQWYLLLGSSF